MTTGDLRQQLRAVLAQAGTGLAAADRLCTACVELLGVDGAAISLVHAGATRGTFGSSSELSRRLAAHQFTSGQGPCLDAAASGRPVLLRDLTAPFGEQWPAFASSALEAGVGAVFVLPITVAAQAVGALDLFCRAPGALEPASLEGELLAAQLARLPLLDLTDQAAERAASSVDVADDEDQDAWSELESLERVEVYQATGMLIAQLGVGPAEALVRLRAHAFTTGATASDVAWAILEHRLALTNDRPCADEPRHR